MYQSQVEIITDRQALYNAKLSVGYMPNRVIYAGRSYAGGARVEQLELEREMTLCESCVKLIEVKATGTLSSYSFWFMPTKGAYFAKVV